MLKHRNFLLAVFFLMTCSAAVAAEKAAEKTIAKPVAKAVETTAVKPAAKQVQKPVEKPVAKAAAKSGDKVVYITTAGNKKIGVREKQFNRLMRVKSAGVTFLYPTVIPAGFQLKHIRVLEKDPKHLDYKALFHKKKRGSFTIETAYSGIGDGPDGSRTISGKSKEFGSFKISVFKPHTEGNKTKSIYYLSDWLKLKKKQSKDAIRFYHFYGTGVSDSEAIAIVKSLTPIK